MTESRYNRFAPYEQAMESAAAAESDLLAVV
jgi:hypothetical protein